MCSYLQKNDDDKRVEWDAEEVHDGCAAFFGDVNRAQCAWKVSTQPKIVAMLTVDRVKYADSKLKHEEGDVDNRLGALRTRSS